METWASIFKEGRNVVLVYADVAVIAGFKRGIANPVWFYINTDPLKKVFEVSEFTSINKSFLDDCIVTVYTCRLKEPDIEVTMRFYAHKHDGFWWSIDSHEKQLV